MADIKYNEEVLKTQAEAMGQCYLQIKSANGVVNQRLNSVGNFWGGASSEEFISLVNELKTTQETAMINFQISIKKLENVVGVYTLANIKVKKKNEALPTEGIFLE